MKWRFHRKARKDFQTTAICLALSQSVFAMPTGGKVIEDDITGITNGTIASGGTINVAGSGLIDWNAYGIGVGEKLNYAFTSPGMLINHVTGADMSQLLGTLNSQGEGNLWLINPNGIVVGSSAQLNAGSLVLSTLNATDEALKGFLHGGDLTLTSADATKGIEVQSGAKVSAMDLTMLGGHIQIADNVTVSSTGASGNDGNGLALLTGSQVVWTENVQNDLDHLTASDANVISVNYAALSAAGPMALIGGRVTVEKFSLTATGDDGFVDVNARASYTDADDGPYVNQAVSGMDVNVKDTRLRGDDGVGVFGHTVTVDGDSSLTSKVFLAAGKTVEMTDDSLKGDGDSVNIGKNVTYDASKTLFAPDKKLIETTTPSDPGTKPSDPGTTPSDPGTKPSKPPVVTPDPQPAADIAKNIAQGQADMAKALQENPQQAAAAVQQQAEKLSRSTMTETEKVAQLRGYVEAIQAMQEGAETKNALLVAVIKNFEPTQQAGLDAQSKQNEAAQNQTAKAAVATDAAGSQQMLFSEDTVSPVTVDAVAAEG
ncbi:filamentous hemagglutinin N-terminal domain-containing protein [uncultured Selenomonas sp.]|uniref:two-partner secretion domain-containing protein n=1 Tax=uncultured Selenomonas sp. TaxID=159275 RepID=UPI002588F2A7|nr:filamentous hemagglutinin N-terminal domain-containing protein [uncultured Selenomonas sp.]